MSDVKGTADSTRNTRGGALEPIAIVGMGCRYPGGAVSPSAFWDLLRNGVDAITEVPADRWNIDAFYDADPKSRGRMYSRWGGFLEHVDRFDAHFFKIAPREAALMDPQQRLLLEVCWEALEDGGQDIDCLAGTDVGVFVGISTHDYSDMQAKDPRAADVYTNTGGALSIAANRVSYCFDFRGPSLAVDTACSSSLVAVHLACQSLRSGESSVALVGGVNCLLTPETTIGFSRAMMLSPHGRCRAFDAAADGYVRGEGAGAVVLKTLSAAIAAGDQVHAVILGSGVNQDGHSNGLTVPNADAQEALLREVYLQAAIEPDQVLYFEAHGTGTGVGDPLEAFAVGAALGRRRASGRPLRIGSLKTNIGHLEAGAGIASLIKSALLISHRQIPATLHFRSANPKIPLQELGLQVQQAFETVPEDETATVVGVNSFGFGGTNAHVALDCAPRGARGHQADAARRLAVASRLVPISARSQDALGAAAGALRDRLNADAASVSLDDLCYTLGNRRTHHDYRLGVLTSSVPMLADDLDAFTRGDARPGLVSGRRSSSRRPRLAFVFSGMGPQWWGMGQQLLADEPVYRRAVNDVDELFAALSGWSLLGQLTADAERSRMQEAQVAQPANFALQVGLLALWRSWGILPDAIVGHSAGEVSAVYAAGILSLEDAVHVIYHRSRLQQLATDKGRMLAAGLPPAEASGYIRGFGGRVSVAAFNSPTSVTFTGDEDALEEIAGTLRSRELFARMLDGRVPYHSHHMDPLKAELLASLQEITPRAATVRFYSVVSGERADGREVDAAYWCANVREPVNFAPAVEKILEDGIDAFLELSPHPVMGRSVLEIQGAREAVAVPVLASMRRETPERLTLLATLSNLYTLGCRVDWEGVNGDGTQVPLPGYQWQRERCWSEPSRSIDTRLPASSHPLLQRRLESSNPIWQTNLDGSRLAYLRDHVIQGAVVFPGAAYIETALAVSRELYGEAAFELEDLRFKRALILRDEETPRLQFALQTDGTFAVHSCLQVGQAWSLNATGRVVEATSAVAPTAPDTLADVRARCRRRLSGERSYEQLAAIGFDYGPTFRGLEEVWQGHREALGRVWCPEELAGEGNDGHLLHPAVFDACLQIVPFVSALEPGAEGANDTILPVEVGRLRFRGSVGGRGMWCHVKLVTETRNSIHGDITVFDDDGAVIAELSRLKGQRVANAKTAAHTEELNGLLHDLEWFARSLPSDERLRQGDYIPGATTLAAQLVTPDTMERLERGRHEEEVGPRLDRLCAAYAFEALRALGWSPTAGQTVDFATLSEQHAVAASQQSHVSTLLGMLAAEGVLQSVGDGWKYVAPFEGDARALRDAVSAAFPDYDGLVNGLQRCGDALADILRGAQPPEAILSDDLDRAIGESPFGAFAAVALRASIRAVVDSLPKGKTLRVLEIGGGWGGVTTQLLPLLPRHSTEYVYAVPSEDAASSARSHLSEYPFVDVARIDLDADLSFQGFGAHTFDLVIGAGPLFLSANLPRALSALRTRLSSGGLLLLAEATRAVRPFEFLYGPALDRRALHPADPRTAGVWLTVGAWTSLLEECGFVDTAAVSDAGAAGEGRECVLLARGPAVAHAAPPSAVEFSSAATWIVFTDGGGTGLGLAAELESRGDVVVRVEQGADFGHVSDFQFQVRPGSLDDMVAVVRSVGELLPACAGLVHLWSLDADDDEASSSGAPATGQRVACLSAMLLIQALGKAGVVAPPRLWLVTRGAQRVGLEIRPTEPSQALLWGLGRVAMNEQSQLRATLVDLDPDTDAADCANLVAELRAGDPEQEVAWRGDARHVARVVRTSLASRMESGAGGADGDAGFLLESAKPGALESLRLREVPRRAPGRGEMEVSIKFAGINFRDVMKAMAMYNEHLGEAFRFGDECAGVVVRVGEGVTDFHAGDEVIAIGFGCFGNYITAPVRDVVHKPSHLTLEQAATLPMVFLTVHYALNHVARLKKGERILIHSAAGGVGLAAVQVAQHVGAEIFATAGSVEKRALLRSMGITHVMDSRSLAFADEVMAITEGRGLDVVLNALAGDFLVKSLALLRPTGRFVELGKVDFFENTRLALAPFKRGLSFMGVDLGFLMLHEPDFCRHLFDEVIQMFEEGSLRPLPVLTFPASEASSAFRMIVQARHIGKLALAMDNQQAHIVRVPTRAALFRDDATYLVTGGARGFGLATAEWMVEQGARHLVLVGRSGAGTADAEAAIARLRDAGARVVVAKADVSREDQVVALLDDIRQSMPPLRGVFHAAAVFDDGYLLQMDAERFEGVVAPKALGAWQLHRHTLDQPLDYFVMFSSISSLVGSPGQASYAAANAYLDALAHRRRAMHLPALSVNWTAISDVGYFARHEQLQGELQRQGLGAITPAEAMSVLGLLLRSSASQVAALRLDRAQTGMLRSSEAVARRFSFVLSQSTQNAERGAGSGAKALLLALAAAATDLRPQLVAAALRSDLARLLGVREIEIDATRPLVELGIDSLTSVELEAAIRAALGIDLPLGFLVSETVSLKSLSERLAQQSQAAIDLLTANRGAAKGQPATDGLVGAAAGA